MVNYGLHKEVFPACEAEKSGKLAVTSRIYEFEWLRADDPRCSRDGGGAAQGFSALQFFSRVSMVLS
jgi:hypothetical protein